ncbi:MAG: sodium-dependent transporter [Chlamydiales bacterium]|nr:sodium-dependent transporter [Chlamydiales bacterium]
MKPREHWGSRIGFIMATAGSAVGLGSLWKFPYVTGEHGGGFFVIAFLVFTFFVGAPIFAAELIMGRKSQKSPVGAFTDLSNQSQNWKLLGWLCVFINFLILSYYSVVAGWAVNYTLLSLNHFTENRTPQEISAVFDTMYQAGGINLFWHFIFMLLAVGVVYGGIKRGIEYWSKILMPGLLIILIGLLIYGMTLDGFGEAVRFVFYPDLAKFRASSILEALGLSFFTLSVGLGIMLTYGSYMRKSDDIPKTVVTVAIMDVSVALMAALMIFPIIFTFGFTPSAGPGLLFKTLPVLFAKLPGTLVLSTLFFVLVVFTALTSAISILEVLVATFMELLGWSRGKAILWIGLAVFVFGIPSALSGAGDIFPQWSEMYGRNFFDTVDHVSNNWLLPISGMLIAVFAGWFLDKELLKSEFYQGTAMGKLFRPWLFLLKYIAPVAVFLVMLQKGGVLDIDSFFH